MTLNSFLLLGLTEMKVDIYERIFSHQSKPLRLTLTDLKLTRGLKLRMSCEAAVIHRHKAADHSDTVADGQ